MIDPIHFESLRKERPLEIRCHRCKRLLSHAVHVLDDNVKLDTRSDEPVVPERTIALVSRLLAEVGEFIGVDRDGYIVNRADLVGAQDGGERNGCCGPDGQAGPNVFCPCGHAVGTERGDCYMPHFVSLDSHWIDLCPLEWGVKGPDEK